MLNSLGWLQLDWVFWVVDLHENSHQQYNHDLIAWGQLSYLSQLYLKCLIHTEEKENLLSWVVY